MSTSEVRLHARSTLGSDGSLLAVVFSPSSGSDFTREAVISYVAALTYLQTLHTQLKKVLDEQVRDGPTREVMEMLARHQLLRYVPKNLPEIPSYGDAANVSLAESLVADLRGLLSFSDRVCLELLVDDDELCRRLGWLLSYSAKYAFDSDAISKSLPFILDAIDNKISEQVDAIMSHETFVKAKSLFQEPA
jgi:hypothetical protein